MSPTIKTKNRLNGVFFVFKGRGNGGDAPEKKPFTKEEPAKRKDCNDEAAG